MHLFLEFFFFFYQRMMNKKLLVHFKHITYFKVKFLFSHLPQIATLQLGLKEVELQEDNITNVEEDLDIITEKGSNYCRKIFILGVVIITIVYVSAFIPLIFLL